MISTKKAFLKTLETQHQGLQIPKSLVKYIYPDRNVPIKQEGRVKTEYEDDFDNFDELAFKNDASFDF